MGKGSRQRPTDYDKYNVNWERIFGTIKDSKEKQKDKPKESDSKKNK